ncbi:MAG: hypothetical protein FJX76_10410 [Armatimonadetes bacterium]|nr:hypothetical protein [Armatimonadota bacterium]
MRWSSMEDRVELHSVARGQEFVLDTIWYPEAAMNGVPLYSIQKLMGHKSIRMTERYAHLCPDYLQTAVDTPVKNKKPASKPINHTSQKRNVVKQGIPQDLALFSTSPTAAN